jgi:pSer/pThr/pTyr-binding forkhead associated (FHA) protein
MFKLVIQDDEGKTTVVPLIRDEITIGRKEGNTIRLTERNVSRRHARILRSNNEVHIEDLGSYNGIRVNNARIAERVSLRVSDQVQIGDYKLYLKAEGVEQIDDARTMPIERLESGTPTESMPAITPPANGSASATPTVPIMATPAPGARAIGSADTDPGARPVATAAQIQAHTNPQTGYGKLVVLSSNFAGKEFELTRPQMIVGRTDENDLVVNHRSISRNHAKVTRDPETQRYTISDLQSSNGVRVNGSDYGKVELRRGDVVDLGHVRMRFVEPGEDFVFARDGVIADVEGTGSKKGTTIAVILAILVIGAVGAFFIMKNGGGAPTPVADRGSDRMVVNGSDGSGSAAVITPEPTLDAAVSANGEAQQIIADCETAQTAGNWADLSSCGSRLMAIDAKAAERYKAKAKMEAGADRSKGHIQQALKDENYKQAKKELGDIPDDSVLKGPMKDAISAADDKFFTDRKVKALGLAQANKCGELDKWISQTSSQNPDVAARLKSDRELACKAPVVVETDCSTGIRNSTAECKQQFCKVHPDSPRCGGGQVAAPSCDADSLKNQGIDAETRGDYLGAVSLFDQSIRCKPDMHVTQLAFMSSCNGGSLQLARKYWKRLSPSAQNLVVSIALRAHIERASLDAP